MKHFLLLALLSCTASCTKKTPIPADELAGTKWERFAFNEPMHGNPVYSRIEFKDSGAFEEYFYSDGKYVSEIKNGTYSLSGQDLTLVLNGNVTNWNYTGVKIISKIPGVPIVTYEKLL